MDRALIQKRIDELLKQISNPKEFTKGLQELLKSCADKDASSNYRKLIPRMGRAFGTPKPVLAVIADELGKYGKNNPNSIFPVLETLWQNGFYEERDIVGKTIEKLGERYPDECLRIVPGFLSDVDNWAVCDVLAGMGMRPLVKSRTKEVLLLCEKCVKDRNKWIRRFGVVTLWAFKKIPAPPKVFEILCHVMSDKDKDVKKGAGWILRQMTSKNSDKIAAFLMRWAKVNPSKDAKWIIKTGMKKLPLGTQNEILKCL